MADHVEAVQSEYFYEQLSKGIDLLESIDARLARIEAVVRSTSDPGESGLSPPDDDRISPLSEGGEGGGSQ